MGRPPGRRVAITLCRLSPLHRFSDTRDRVAGLAAGPTNRGRNLPHGLVNVTLSLQLVVSCQPADSLLGLALHLIDFPLRSFLFHM